MKILQLTNKVPYPPKDGGSIAVFSLSKNMAEMGHNVTILAMNTDKHYVVFPEKIKLPQNIELIGVDVDTSISVNKAFLNFFFSRKPYNAIRFISENYKKTLVDILSKFQYDIVQLEGLYLAPYIETIKKHSKAKISFRAHNIEHEIWQRTSKQVKNFFKRLYLKNLGIRIRDMEKNVMNQYDCLVPITSRDAKCFENMGNKKPVHVCPAGIDIENIEIRENVEYPSLFHLGALDWPPNQEGILWFIYNCWDKIRKHNPGLKFYIAGRNAPSWFVEKIKLPNIEFLGEIENAAEFLNSKAIMIVPLLSGSGMRIKIIEGLAYKKVVIATSIGAEGIEVNDNEHLFIADTPSKYVEVISDLVNDQNKYILIGENASQLIYEKYDNNKIVKQLLNFYQEEL